MAKDVYYENYLKQAVNMGGVPVVIYTQNGVPVNGLYVLEGNKTMCLPIADVERKKRELKGVEENEK